MNQLKFTKKDFDTFKIEGLDDRMEVLKESVRPKLERLGKYFAPILQGITNDEMNVHVAKHARRSVNPPEDSWVAFSNSKRGYKKLPHFQIGLWETHVFVWFALIYESPLKKEYGALLEDHLQDISQQIPENFVWSADHTKPDTLSNSELSNEQLKTLLERLQTIKKAELLCGITISKEDVMKMNNREFLSVIEHAFKEVAYLYRLLQKEVQKTS